MPDQHAPERLAETFRAELARLVSTFAANEAEYTSPGYPEAQARTDFISPFFRALGWDVENRAGLPYTQREVIEEKGPGPEPSGRPDYTFRIAGTPKFFVEAKPPHEDLDAERHVLQAKRYAWSTKEVFAVILTDFEEFRAYDTMQPPAPHHDPEDAPPLRSRALRHKGTHYTRIPEPRFSDEPVRKTLQRYHP